MNMMLDKSSVFINDNLDNLSNPELLEKGGYVAIAGIIEPNLIEYAEINCDFMQQTNYLAKIDAQLTITNLIWNPLARI